MAVANALASSSAFVTAPIMTHVLGVRGRGISAGSLAPLQFLAVAATLGIPATVTYAVSKSPGLLRPVTWRALAVTFVTGLAATAMVVGFAGLISEGQTQLHDLMIDGSFFITPTLIVGVLAAAAAALRRWTLIAIQSLLASVLAVVATVVLVTIGSLTVTSATFTLAASPLAGALAYLPLVSALRLPASADTVHIKSLGLAKYSGTVWAGTLGAIVLDRVDQVVMTAISTPIQLGLYSVAVGVGELPNVVSYAFLNVLMPEETALPDSARLEETARVSTLLVALVCACVAAVAPFLLGPVFGGGFRRSYPALLAILGSWIVSNPGAVASVGLRARGRPGAGSLAMAVGVATSLPTLVVLAPGMGALGAGIATIVGQVTACLVELAAASRYIGLSPVALAIPRMSDAVLLGRGLMSILGRLRGIALRSKP